MTTRPESSGDSGAGALRTSWLAALHAGARARPRRSAALAGLAVLTLAALAGFIRLTIDVRALRARHATGPSWSFPSRVYSDGVALAPGARAPGPTCVRNLRRAATARP